MYIEAKELPLLKNRGLKVCVEFVEGEKTYCGTMLPFCFRPREREIGICMYDDAGKAGWVDESFKTFTMSVVAFIDLARVKIVKIVYDLDTPAFVVDDLTDVYSELATPFRTS